MRYPYEVGQRLARPEPGAEPAPESRAAVQRPADPARARPGFESTPNVQSQVLGARALAPLYRAILARPGLNVGREAFTQAFEKLKALYQSSLDRICWEARSDGSEALLRIALAAPVAGLVADAWELADASVSPQLQDQEIGHLVELYTQQTIACGGSLPSLVDQDTPSGVLVNTAESLAEYRAVCTATLALLQVWALRPATQRLYLSDRRAQDVMAHIRLVLTDSAAEIAEGLMPEARDQEQAGAYSTVLEALGELYRVTLDAQFTELSRRIRDMDAKQKRAYLESIPHHPDGLLIESTDQLFAIVAPASYTLNDQVESLPWNDETATFSSPVRSQTRQTGAPRVGTAPPSTRPDLGLECHDGT
jgi:hypothetical protein